MRKRFAVIGLDDDLAERVKNAICEIDWDTNVIVYSSVPSIEHDAALRIESPSVAGCMLDVSGVIYYSYFEGVEKERLALTFSATPTFPNIRATQSLDDKLAALVLALRADPDGGRAPARWVARSRAFCNLLSSEEKRIIANHPGCVIKSGNEHCGHGKWLTEEFLDQIPPSGAFLANGPIYIEPFIRGESVRILLVGDRAWQLHYVSDNWRKNVQATVTPMQSTPSCSRERVELPTDSV